MIRAIGKGSLASILAVGLHIVRAIVWVVLVGLTVALIITPLAPALIDWASGVKGADISGDIDIGPGAFVKVLYHFVTVAVTLYVIERLLELLKTLRLGSPFVKDNADRFKRVGFALLFGEGAKIALAIAGAAADADIDLDLDLVTFLAIAAVFVLAEVFSEGARMKEEQDLTV